MGAAAFPGLVAHHKQHRTIVAQLEALADKQAEGSITVASPLSGLMRDGLSLHIRRSDRELVTFLQAKKRIAQRPVKGG